MGGRQIQTTHCNSLVLILMRLISCMIPLLPKNLDVLSIHMGYWLPSHSGCSGSKTWLDPCICNIRIEINSM